MRLPCIESDTRIYGEPYWHRIHQLPGVYICPIHGSVIIDSGVELDDLRRDYYPLLSDSDNFAPSFGEPPYPCRNFMCDYNLQDVIEQIEIKKVHGAPYAAFVCPYCGFSYNRKGNVPKEKQYTGQIHIAEYGWLWKETVTALLKEGKSPYKIAREFHCDVCTILTFGVDTGLLPSERRMGRIPYTRLASNLLPKTKTFVSANVDTLEK